MKTYARMVDGEPVESITPFVNPEGIEVPIEERFTPEIVAQLVEIEAPVQTTTKEPS